ncbi:MAG: NAD(P)-dependent oxidoreductase, partial [Gammaproteobacteria bacterium]
MPDKQNILITTSSFDVQGNACLQEISRSGFNILTNPYARRLSEEEVHDLIQELEPVGLIAGVEPLTRKVMQASSQLKVLSRCGTGVENVDQDAAKEFGITVRNTPDAPTRAVAELTIGSMLNLLRSIGESDRSIRSGDFKKPMGRLLGACTIGIIGYGRIGREVARLCRAFGARILVYDEYQTVLDDTVEVTGLDQLLEVSDVVSLHIPGTAEGGHFMDRKKLEKMKKGAF